MRIGLITDRFRPESRAAAVLAAGLAEGLAGRGHRVEVWTRRSPVSPPGASAEWDPCPVHRLHPLTSSSKPILRLLDQASAVLRLAFRCVFGRQPDVWFVYSPPLLYTLPALLSRWLRGTPCVVNLHDLYPQAAIDLGILTNPVVVGIARLLERSLYRGAGRILVAAPGSVRILSNEHGVPARKLEILWNWAEPFTPSPPERLREWRARWQADDSLVVLYAGLMGWAQDLETVLRVARSVDGRRSWRFVLIGEGPKAAHWKQSAAGLANTIFLPPVSSQEYPQAVEAADICLVPLVSTFRAPAVPGKVSSILAAGRPIAASVPDGNDTAVVLRDSRAGTAVPAGDAAALESAIEVLAGDAALRATMGRNGQAWIEKHATRAAAVSQCELALREVIAGARRLAPKDSTWSPCSS